MVFTISNNDIDTNANKQYNINGNGSNNYYFSDDQRLDAIKASEMKKMYLKKTIKKQLSRNNKFK